MLEKDLDLPIASAVALALPTSKKEGIIKNLIFDISLRQATQRVSTYFTLHTFYDRINSHV